MLDGGGINGKVLCILIPLLVSIAYLTLGERKVLGYIQGRKGPNVVGLYGVLQPLMDGLKLLTKEIKIPNRVNVGIYNVGPGFFFDLGYNSVGCGALWGGGGIE